MADVRPEKWHRNFDSMNMNSKVYPSRVDLWIAVILIAIPLFPIGLGTYLTIVIGWIGVICIMLGILIAGLMIIMTIPCKYTLTDDSLIVQCGWNEEIIKIHRIKSVLPSHNLLSAPALSLKRVKLVLDHGFALISPVDRNQFIRDIEQRIKQDA